uniref:Predicted protein n=1 Tax=Hordeum vulgare subsp. vulgare TaxID=112509 RepID=F2DL24_HORVV|nr:predicted protein [Hordeum vulgare subsp. vulgare]
MVGTDHDLMSGYIPAAARCWCCEGAVWRDATEKCEHDGSPA